MSIKQSLPATSTLCEGSSLRINSVIVFIVAGILLSGCGQGREGANSAGVISSASAAVQSSAPTPIPLPILVSVASAAFDPSKLPDGQHPAFPTEERFGAASRGGRVDLAHVVSCDAGQKARRCSSGNASFHLSGHIDGPRCSSMADDLAGDHDAAGNLASTAGPARASSPPMNCDLPVA